MRILAVKTHAMGDVLMTTPALRALKSEFPAASVDYLVGTWSAGILKNNPHIDELIAIPDTIFMRKRVPALLKLMIRLRRGSYDMGVLFQPARGMKLLLMGAGISQLAAPVEGGRWPSISHPVPWRRFRDRYVGEDFLDVVRAVGAVDDDKGMEFHLPDGIGERIDHEIEIRSIDRRRLIVVCPGGGRNPRDFVAQKLWPEESYRVLIADLIREKYSVILAGTAEDRKRMQKLGSMGDPVNMMGKTTLDELAGWIRSARLVVTNDSLPLHLSLALDTPVIPIFGPSRPAALIPPGSKAIPLVPNVRCAPCYDNEPFPGCSRFECIRSVTVDEVSRNIDEAMTRW